MNIISYLFCLVFLTNSLCAQQNHIVEPMNTIKFKQFKLKEKEFNKDHKINYDSINNSFFCRCKEQEFDSLRKIIKEKIDSTYLVIERLKYKHPGVEYFIERRIIKNFDWNICFANAIKSSHSYDDCIEMELRIGQKEKSHFNADGTSGWTIYYDDIQRSPR